MDPHIRLLIPQPMTAATFRWFEDPGVHLPIGYCGAGLLASTVVEVPSGPM